MQRREADEDSDLDAVNTDTEAAGNSGQCAFVQTLQKLLQLFEN